MKRRLTLAILGTVAAALLLAGAGTLVLARFGARQTAEDELRNQVESTAALIDLSQSRSGQLNAADLDAVRALVCNDPDDSPAPSTTTVPPVTLSEADRVRLALCDSSPDAVVVARRQLCENAPARLDQVLTQEMRASRTVFCADPKPETLDGIRVAYCKNATSTTVAQGPGAAARRRAEQVRVNLCRAVNARTDNQRDLQSALSRERIDLIVFRADNTTRDELPGALGVADLQPERLRQGESVSGFVGNGAYAAAPVDPTAENMAVVVISRPSDPVKGLIPWFLLASGFTLLLGLGVAAWLGRALTHPLREATTVTAQIADGDLSVRVPEHVTRPGRAPDELAALAHAINAMAEALERSRGLERQFLLSVSHDLRTPLTSIRGYAEAIADGATTDPATAASIILAESRRLERLVQDLLDLAKLDARRFTFHISQVDLGEIAGDSVDGFRREVEAAGLRIHLDAPPVPVVAYADPDRLQQVIANLIENALKYASTTITVRVRVADAGPRIEVEDDGPGIAAADMGHVFERLYVTSAKPQRKEVGSGLGLAIVREVTEMMGGHVEADAADAPSGTRIVVTLATRPPTTPPAPPADTI